MKSNASDIWADTTAGRQHLLRPSDKVSGQRVSQSADRRKILTPSTATPVLITFDDTQPMQLFSGAKHWPRGFNDGASRQL